MYLNEMCVMAHNSVLHGLCHTSLTGMHSIQMDTYF